MIEIMLEAGTYVVVVEAEYNVGSEYFWLDVQTPQPSGEGRTLYFPAIIFERKLLSPGIECSSLV